MQEVKKALIKQKQLIEIELGEYKLSQTFDHPPIYEESYYAKLAWVYKLLDKSIELLDSTKEEVYNDNRAELFTQ